MTTLPARPILTVVVPAFDSEHEVGRAIDSILADPRDDLELIVVDDGSTDGTGAAVESIKDPRLHLFHQEREGVGAARNAGVAASRADFVTFLDADDIALDGWVGFHAAAAEAAVDLSTCGARFRLPDGRLTKAPPERLGPTFGGLTALLLAGGFGVSKRLYDCLGGYRKGLRYSENTELGFRLGAAHLNEPLQVRATDELLFEITARTTAVDWRVRYESAVDLIQNSSSHLERDPRLLGRYLGIAGISAGHLGLRAEQRHYLARAIRADPLRPKSYARLLRTFVSGP